MKQPLLSLGLGITFALGMTQTGFGQCATFDFEEFSEGTVATNLIPGVTIETTGSCGSGNPVTEIYELVTPDGPTKVVTPRTGCPDFSPDKLLLTFDENQSSIQFRVAVDFGDSGHQVRVRWWNEFGTLLGTRLHETASGTGLLVSLEKSAAIIRTVEVGHIGDFFESIDELSFGADSTPPDVEISAPAFDACVCGGEAIGITGSVGDDDGTYGCDRAEYRPINAGPSDPWIQFGEACGAYSGTLHTWNTAALPAGRYYVRITGTNVCGLSQSDVTVLRVDRSFGTLSLPAIDDPLCGIVTIDGEVSDPCGVDWALDYRPASGGSWTTIVADSSGRDCELGDWDTTVVDDGDYTLRLSATDGCGHSDTVTRSVTVDNQGGCGSADINGDGVVDFADILILLTQWS